MILILSERGDLSTYHVAQCIEAIDENEVIIVTGEDKISDFRAGGDGGYMVIGGQRIGLEEIDAFWYRRGFLNWEGLIRRGDFPEAVKAALNEEMGLIDEWVNYLICNKPHLDSIYQSEPNRLIVLEKARKAGFAVPDYEVICRRAHFDEFARRHRRVVTKPIGKGLFHQEDHVLYNHYTSMVEYSEADGMPECFFPSLVMGYVEKKYEVRVFYLDKVCYSMAILSQNDGKTMVDYRHYNIEKKNRNEPYKLPKEVEKKTAVLMQSVPLKTGSLDLIVTPGDEFVFLEVNPVGQFLNVSHTCHYDLENEIAVYLNKLANEHKRHRQPGIQG